MEVLWCRQNLGKVLVFLYVSFFVEDVVVLVERKKFVNIDMDVIFGIFMGQVQGFLCNIRGIYYYFEVWNFKIQKYREELIRFSEVILEIKYQNK